MECSFLDMLQSELEERHYNEQPGGKTKANAKVSEKKGLNSIAIITLCLYLGWRK